MLRLWCELRLSPTWSQIPPSVHPCGVSRWTDKLMPATLTWFLTHCRTEIPLITPSRSGTLQLRNKGWDGQSQIGCSQTGCQRLWHPPCWNRDLASVKRPFSFLCDQHQRYINHERTIKQLWVSWFTGNQFFIFLGLTSDKGYIINLASISTKRGKKGCLGDTSVINPQIPETD